MPVYNTPRVPLPRRYRSERANGSYSHGVVLDVLKPPSAHHRITYNGTAKKLRTQAVLAKAMSQR